jgi:hypothetical protein
MTGRQGNQGYDTPPRKVRALTKKREGKLQEGVLQNIDRHCTQCDDPLPGFQAVNGNKWFGQPVLYMGIHPQTGYAMKYQFCEAECMLDWLKEILGE